MLNKFSKNGATFTRLHEGFMSNWYLDPVGIPTIGIGFTWRSVSFRKWWEKNKPGIAFERGASMTRAEADDALQFLVDTEYGKAVNNFLKKKVAQNVYDGMVSPVYNLGPGSLKWKWAAAIKRGDVKAGAKLLSTTGVTARGKKLRGLVRRRKEEALLLSDGIYTGVGSESHSPVLNAMADGMLERGEAGPDVGKLIEDLHELGFYNGALDDKFGHGTEAAVLEFQRANGMKADGKAGPKTLKAVAGKSSSESAPVNDKPRVKNPNSKILPLYRPRQSDEVTRAVLKKFSDMTPESRRDDPVKVLMVRGYYQDSMGAKGRNDRRMYDDAIFVVTPDGVQCFNGNSDPSVYRKRVATLKSPQAVRYKPGLHGYSRKAGPYPAFRQNSNVTVVRDKVGEDHGMFHINFHRGGVNGTSSLGCQTVPPHQWDEFYKLVKGLLDRHNQETFYVTLVEYAGDNPPVTIPKKTEPPVKTGAVAVVAVTALTVSWWDNITTWIGSFF
jgi:lysozyme